jgi:CubicO group peptidase (beta-lactamase class C family)
MNKYGKLSTLWMVIGALLATMAIFPGAGLGDEAVQALSPGDSHALQLLSKSEGAAKTRAGRRLDERLAYLRKKHAYRRFLDNYIAEKRMAFEDEGLSISVISENDLLFLKGYGYADKETLTPATPLTLFCVGSVSKLFTGIAVMQLVEQGRIDLDAPLETYIPDFGYKTHFPDAGPITVRTLMTHQSGIVGDIVKGWCSVSGPDHHFRELVDVLRDEYLAYPPGYISTYSNCAVALLGIVIEEVSGVEFKTYVQNHICRPLGMLTSNFSLRDYMHPMLAKSYDSTGARSPFLYIRDEPAGSFISNTLEMSLFMRMILNGGKLFGRRILRQSTLEQMFVQQNSEIEFDFPKDHGARWGLSWVLSHPVLSYAGKYVGHDGFLPPNYSTQMHILPEHGLAVIVETNSLEGQQIISDIADIAMMKALEIFKGIKRPDPQPLPPIVPLTPQHIAQTEGTYATNDLGILSIYPKNSGLFGSFTGLGSLELELLPHKDDWFSLYLNGQPAPGFINIRIIVKNLARKRFAGLQIRTASGLIYSSSIGCEYQIPDEPPPEWTNRVGQYNVINPDPYMLVDMDALIQVLPSGAMYYINPDVSSNVLDPIFEDEAVRTGLGRNINETIQVVDCDGGECLYHLGYLLKKQTIATLPDTRGTFSASDLQKKGREVERKLIQRFRFPGASQFQLFTSSKKRDTHSRPN